MARACEICGARVRNMNPRVTTCSPECTEKRNAKRGALATGTCTTCGDPTYQNFEHCAQCASALRGL